MSWIRRSIFGAVMVFLGLGLMTAPASAAPLPDNVYQPPKPFSYDGSYVNKDCKGAKYKVTYKGKGVEWILNVPGSDGQAFLANNKNKGGEVWKNKKTGKWFTVSWDTIFQETGATFVPNDEVPAELIPEEGLVGPVYLFTALETGKPFTVRKANGKLVLQDKGTVFFESLQDTLGDHEPGSTELDFQVVAQRGSFPGDDVNLCKLAKRLTT